MVKAYWRFIFARAFKEACETLHLDTRERVVIAAFVIIFGILCLIFWGSADASRDEAVMRGGIIAATLATLFFLFAWKVVSVPAAVHGAQTAELDSLHLRLTPRLSLSLPTDAATMLSDGITQVAMSGHRVGILQRQPIVLRLTCSNESDVQIGRAHV